MRISAFFILIFFIDSCGSSSNILGLLTPKSHKESYEVQLALAEANYDADDLEAALKYGEEAYSRNPNSERASTVLGYIYLSLAGIGPFDLAKKMNSQKDDKESDSENAELLLAESSTNSTLSSLSDVVGLTDTEFQLLGEKDESDPDLPVIVPVCAGEARTVIEKLTYVNKAIKVICPFVDESVRLQEDYRHTCENTTLVQEKKAKSHFLWAFAHLTEALAFHSVLTYSTQSDSGKTNLEARVEKIKDTEITSPADIAGFLENVSSLENTITKVMPISGACSEEYPQTQLIGLLNDMLAVNAAFANMPGVPKKITESIKKAMEKIEEIRSKSADVSSDDTSKAFKGDMTKNIGGTLGTKIDALSAEGQEFDQQETTEICDSYSSITGGSEEGKPAICLKDLYLRKILSKKKEE